MFHPIKVLLVFLVLHTGWYIFKAMYVVDSLFVWLLTPLVLYGMFTFLVTTWRAVSFRENFFKAIDEGRVTFAEPNDDEDNEGEDRW